MSDMHTVDLPLTDAEWSKLQALAAAAEASVGVLLAEWVRWELEAAEAPLRPNLG